MIQNCKIVRTELGYEDHPILTCWLHLEGAGWAAVFGGVALDEWDKALGKRIIMAKGFAAVKALMDTLEVKSWEKLQGQLIRAETEGSGNMCFKIGHLMKDKWFSFEEFFKGEEKQG